MSRDEALATLREILASWYNEHSPGEPQANVISAGIIVLYHLGRKFPLERDDYRTPGGQVSLISRVPKILQSLGENRRWPSEAGRTSRGTLPMAESLVERFHAPQAAAILNGLDPEERQELLGELQLWMLDRAREFLDRRRLEIEVDPRKPAPLVIEDILAAAERIKKAGAVAHHLVGAKLALRYPNRLIENRPYTTADHGLPGDYVIGDTAIHVTVAPMPALFEHRVADNIRNQFRPKVLVPRQKAPLAEGLAEQAGVGGKVDVASIEGFVGPNIEELAGFSAAEFARYLRLLLETYNSRVEAVEADRSLLLRIPENLPE